MPYLFNLFARAFAAQETQRELIDELVLILGQAWVGHLTAVPSRTARLMTLDR